MIKLFIVLAIVAACLMLVEKLLGLRYKKPKEQSVAESIQGAKEQLLIITGGDKDGLLTSQHIPMLQEAIARGVKIRIIFDQTVEKSFIQEIKDLGVKAVFAGQSMIASYGLLVDDGLRLITGSHGSYTEITKPIFVHDAFQKQFYDLWVDA